MESPAKRNVYGYVHNITPVKHKDNGLKYFNGTLQEENSFTDFVSFSPETHHEILSNFQESRSPVMLQNVQLVPSFRKSGMFDIKINQKTSITKPTARVLFTCEPPVIKTDYKLEDLKDLNNYAKVTIKCKIVDIGPIETRDVRGSKMPLQSIRVADSTASTTVALWAKQTDTCSLGKSYSLKNVTVRKYEGTSSLSAGENCVIEEIADIGYIKQTETPTITSILNISVLSTSCSEHFQCGFCQSRITTYNLELSTVKCTKCNHRQKLKTISKTMTCEVSGTVENKKTTVTISDSVIKQTYGNISCDDVETKILEKDIFSCEVVSHNKKVTKILPSENTVSNITSLSCSPVPKSVAPAASTSAQND